MRQELKRVDPLRTANISAMVYGLLTSAFALIAFPFVLLAGLLAPAQGSNIAGPVFAIFILVLYPVMGAVMGWISGLLTSAIYNFIVRWTGGLILEFDGVAPSSSSGAAPTSA